jgi:hypothetical protein
MEKTYFSPSQMKKYDKRSGFVKNNRLLAISSGELCGKATWPPQPPCNTMLIYH